MAAIVAMAVRRYMNAGTTTDTFLRENLEWLGRASNWAKFTATASLGVVHKGHVKESMNILQVRDQLPSDLPSAHPPDQSHELLSSCPLPAALPAAGWHLCKPLL
jgi:hypothetical protein